LKRFGQPDDIANTALFLGSSDASFMTGAEIVVDGGMGQL
jgi:NAD(P)-dependent dehydrogenase (short-subunit alcohol dehydrogenase family)